MCRWEVNIKTDPQKMGWIDMDWIYLAQDGERQGALVNVVMNFQVS
jgi:hypothetical protein